MQVLSTCISKRYADVLNNDVGNSIGFDAINCQILGCDMPDLTINISRNYSMSWDVAVNPITEVG